MSHPRAQLRQAAVTALTGLPTTGSRVFVDREYTMQQTDLPCLHVSVSESTRVAGFPAIYVRSVSLRVRLLAKATTGLSALLDQIALEVEGVLLAGLPIGGEPLLPQDFTASDPELSVLTDQPVGEQMLTFDYVLHVTASAPGSVL